MQQHPHLEKIKESDGEKIYQQFIDVITEHNHLYYVENNPIISDKQYDELFTYLKNIEDYFPHLLSANSPTQQLVWQISEWFSHAAHKVKMLSLENSYHAEDLQDFDDFIQRNLAKHDIENYSYTIEPKFDGISVELIYKNGNFHQAITRGDGQTGDDITNNAKMIANIPKKLSGNHIPQTLHLRGEIMMPKSSWEKLNTYREKKGDTPFANPRNAAAGSMKLLDSNIVKERNLLCYVYDIQYIDPDKKDVMKTNIDAHLRMKNIGLPIHALLFHKKDITHIIDTCVDEKLKAQLDSADIEFDGLVIKINEETNRMTLGSTQHHPRRAIAYKYPAQQAATEILSVDFQVGRTGIITPVGNLDPVQLSGVTIKRVSLHNSDFITNKDIHIHDHVRVQRSGEVIPYIVGVIKDQREIDKIRKIDRPKQCPSCNAPVTKVDMHHYCTNADCPAQGKQKLEYFVSKQCMNIETIGEKIIDILVDQQLVHSIPELYMLQEPDKQRTLQSMPWFGLKKIQEIDHQLDASKKKPLRRLINGLGIVWIGKKTAQTIHQDIKHAETTKHGSREIAEAQPFTHKELLTYFTDKEFLLNIYGIGEKIVDGITQYVTQNQNMTKQLQSYGVNFSPFAYDDLDVKHTPRTGQHFSITGSFGVSRDKIVATCEQNGMLFDSTPIQQTKRMLIGSKPGSKKQKATEQWATLLIWREAITAAFPFLRELQSNQTTKGPAVQSLF